MSDGREERLERELRKEEDRLQERESPRERDDVGAGAGGFVKRPIPQAPCEDLLSSG
jgi:hypothetical protein